MIANMATGHGDSDVVDAIIQLIYKSMTAAESAQSITMQNLPPTTSGSGALAVGLKLGCYEAGAVAEARLLDHHPKNERLRCRDTLYRLAILASPALSAFRRPTGNCQSFPQRQYFLLSDERSCLIDIRNGSVRDESARASQHSAEPSNIHP
jgi:hypothetical protein